MRLSSRGDVACYVYRWRRPLVESLPLSAPTVTRAPPLPSRAPHCAHARGRSELLRHTAVAALWMVAVAREVRHMRRRRLRRCCIGGPGGRCAAACHAAVQSSAAGCGCRSRYAAVLSCTRRADGSGGVARQRTEQLHRRHVRQQRPVTNAAGVGSSSYGTTLLRALHTRWASG